jgi:hypothetical protein
VASVASNGKSAARTRRGKTRRVRCMDSFALRGCLAEQCHGQASHLRTADHAVPAQTGHPEQAATSGSGPTAKRPSSLR